MTHKILLDMYLGKNLGDDLFIHILSKLFPKTQFTIMPFYGGYNEFLLEYDNVKKMKYNFISKAFRKIKIYNIVYPIKLSADFDAIIFLGGSIFIENTKTTRLYKERKKFLDAFVSRNKPVFVLGSNFGPFYTEYFLSLYKDFFEKCSDVSFRDTYSYSLFEKNNVVRYNPDIIFGLEPTKLPKQKAVGFSIIDLSSRETLKEYEDTYLFNISELIKKSIKEKYMVVLFSFCEREGDIEAINKLLSILSPEIKKSIEINNYSGDINKSLNRLSEMEIMIATRFHANILSQVFDQGVLPFIYSDKTLNVLHDIQLDEYFVDIRDNIKIDVDYFWEKIKNNKIDIRQISERSKQNFSIIKSYLC